MIFLVPSCDVRYEFRLKTMFSSSLPPVVCMWAHVLFTMFSSSLPPVVCMWAHVLFTLFVFVQFVFTSSCMYVGACLIYDVQFVFTSSCMYVGACLIYVICVGLGIVMSNTYSVVFLFVFLRLVYPIFPVSLDFPFLIAPSVFSEVLFRSDRNFNIRLYYRFQDTVSSLVKTVNICPIKC